MVALALFACPLQAQDTSQAAPKVVTSRPAGGLLFVADELNEPFSYADKDGQAIGYDVDVINAISARIGRKIAVQLMNRNDAMEAVQKGQADGMIGLELAPGREERRQPWVLCGPTMPVDYAIVVAKDVRDVNDLAGLDGTRVAVKENSAVSELFDNNESVTLVSARRPRDGCIMVRGRRVTAFIGNRNAIQYSARTNNLDGLKFVGVTVYSVNDYGPALKAGGDAALAGEIKKAVQQLSAEGTLAKMQQQWFAHELNPASWLDQAWASAGLWALGATVALVLLGMVWRWTLISGAQQRTRKLTGEMEALRRHAADLEARAAAEPRVTAPADEAKELAPAPTGVAPVQLNDLIRQAGETLRQEAGETVAIAYQLDEDVPLVLADPERVRRTLSMLVSNARDAIAERRKGEPDLAPRIGILTRRARQDELPAAMKSSDRQFAAISVRDTGCGIAQELVQKIFQPGYTTKPGSAGQGLTYVYGTVAQHGGWIDVESAPGRGATFSIYLPVVKS